MRGYLLEMWPCRHTINNALRENLGMECMNDGRVKTSRDQEKCLDCFAYLRKEEGEFYLNLRRIMQVSTLLPLPMIYKTIMTSLLIS